MPTRVQLLLVVAAVLLLRLPFLNQPIQGDDVYFLYGAEHALEDPWHPLSARYVFLGQEVDMRGHTHGPVDSWILAAILWASGGVREVQLHAAYTLFSLIAAIAAWWIASRYTDRPLLATLLFLVVPPFVVHGSSLEADLPFLAFWLLVIALYLADRPYLAAAAAVLATLTSYQAILLSPILFLVPDVRRRWLPILAPPMAFAAFQTFERLTGGALPAAVLAGYMQDHGWQSLAMKGRNAVGLTGHLAFNLVSPIAWLGVRRIQKEDKFLLTWAAVFFAGALAIFFAGAARYLLPMALPLCILASRSRFAIPALVVQGVYSVLLAIVSYQHWDGYRELAAAVPKARRIFVNGEWGLRHYLEERGATAWTIGQTFHSGDIIVSTGYATPIDAPKARILEREITSPIPLRMMYLGGGSAFSTVGAGLTPISFSTAPLDRVVVETIVEIQPTLAYVKIGTPEAAAHIVSGIANHDGWSLDRGSIALLRPAAAKRLRAKFYIPPAGTGREVRLAIDGGIVAHERYNEEGLFTLDSPPLDAANAKPGRAIITISTDKPLHAPNDNRPLGVVLTEIGFVNE